MSFANRVRLHREELFNPREGCELRRRRNIPRERVMWCGRETMVVEKNGEMRVVRVEQVKQLEVGVGAVGRRLKVEGREVGFGFEMDAFHHMSSFI